MRTPLCWILGAWTVHAAMLAQVAPAPPGLIPYQTKDKSDHHVWGYADPSGRLVIPAQFEEVRLFGPEGLAGVKRNGLWGMIDRQGNEVIAARNSYQVEFADGLVGACVDNGQPIPGMSVLGPRPGQQTGVMGKKCGYFNRDGKVAIPFEYDWVHPFHEGVAPVSISRKSDKCPAVDLGRATLYGLVDTTGKLVVPVEACHIGEAENGWIRVVHEEQGGGFSRATRVGFVDHEGRTLLPKLPYDFAGEHWKEGVLIVRAGGRWGLIDQKGREVVPPGYEDIWSAAEGRVRAKLGGKIGFLDTAGKVVIPFQYLDAGDFHDGLACVRVGDRTGLIDRAGKMVVEPRFDLINGCGRWFTEGVRATPQGDKWGFIDRTGTFVIPPQFDEAWGFTEGLAAVRKGELWGFVDHTGAFVIPAKYFRVDRAFDKGLAYVTVRVTPPCCPGIDNFSEGFINHTGREFFDKP